MDNIYERMNDDTEELAKDTSDQSQIREFYNGQTIFLTGCTGFLGKCLLEKLLRTCTGIKKIYILIRPKRQKSSSERLKEFFTHIIFNKVRERNPNFMDKVVPVEGELVEPNLGLSPEDHRRICEESTLIIHNGSTVNFLLRISISLRINVYGTKNMLELAKECKNLQAFMYMSTGFSQSHLEFIEEKCYPPPIDMKMIDDIIRADTDTEAGITEEVLNQFRKPYANNYIFTKAIAESLVEEYSKKLPFSCGVYRPTIVCSTAKEPIAFWCEKLNGPVAAVMAYSVGMLRIFYIKNTPFDVVPADYTVNGLIVALWDLAAFKKPREQCYVYHYSSALLKPITLHQLREIVVDIVYDTPTIKMMWYPSSSYASNYTSFMILHCLFHILPCFVIDVIRLATLRRPVATSMVFKESKSLGARIMFANLVWTLDMKSMVNIWDRMSPADEKYFYSDIRKLDWDEYSVGYWAGLRRYMLKDSPDTIPAARKKIKILRILHYTVIGLFAILFTYFVYSIIARVFDL